MSWLGLAARLRLRVIKDFGKFCRRCLDEGPQTTIGGRGFPANFFINAPGAAGGLYNSFDGSDTPQ